MSQERPGQVHYGTIKSEFCRDPQRIQNNRRPKPTHRTHEETPFPTLQQAEERPPQEREGIISHLLSAAKCLNARSDSRHNAGGESLEEGCRDHTGREGNRL